MPVERILQAGLRVRKQCRRRLRIRPQGADRATVPGVRGEGMIPEHHRADIQLTLDLRTVQQGDDLK